MTTHSRLLYTEDTAEARLGTKVFAVIALYITLDISHLSYILQRERGEGSDEEVTEKKKKKKEKKKKKDKDKDAERDSAKDEVIGALHRVQEGHSLLDVVTIVTHSSM